MPRSEGCFVIGITREDTKWSRVEDGFNGITESGALSKLNGLWQFPFGDGVSWI